MQERATKLVVHAPQDNTEHYGSRGELRAGGRKIAGLGDWHYKAVPGGWMVRAGMHNPNDYLIDRGAEFDVRLLFGAVSKGKPTNYIFIGPAVRVERLAGHPEIITIVGTQKLEKIERYGSGHKQSSQERRGLEIIGARALRDVPGGNGRSGGRTWDPARGRILAGF